MREIVEKRNLRSKTFDRGGDKRLLRIGIRKPLHFLNEEGALQDIDLTPSLDRGQHYIANAPYKVRIGREFPGYRYTGERGAVAVELSGINGKPVGRREAEYADGRFCWRGVSLDVDYSLIPRNARLDAILTLHSKNAPRKFSWEIDGNRSILRPIRGSDAKGRPLELEQSWDGDILLVEWTGKVIDKRAARKGQPLAEPIYPVWIDPSVNEAIVAGADDVSSAVGTTTGALRTSDANIQCGVSSTNNYKRYAGLRFQTMAIPNGTTIDSAVLTVDITSITGSPSAKVYAVDLDDAAAWSDPGNRPKDITKTTAVATIGPAATGSYTIGVTAHIQEIVNRTGFASSNDMAFALFGQTATGASNYFCFAAYDHATRTAAQLDINYAGGGGAVIGQGLIRSVLLSPRALVG